MSFVQLVMFYNEIQVVIVNDNGFVQHNAKYLLSRIIE